MRIAFITFEYPPFIIGGAGVYATNLTQELVKLGNEVVVFTQKSDNLRVGEFDGLEIVDVEVNRHLPLTSVQFWLNLPNAVKKAHSIKKFDVVHVNGTSYWFIPGKIIEVPHVVTIHHLSRDAKGDVSSGKSTNIRLMGESSVIYQYLESRCVRFADYIIAVSKFTRGRIIETYDIPFEKIDVIYNGFTPLRTEVSQEEIIKFKNRFNLDSRPIILFVGRIDDPRKGLVVLLDAFSMVSKKVDSKLLIVGKGNSEAIIKRAHDLKIDDNIIVTGFLEPNDLACSYLICDVYVCPSAMEGFGLTVLEASAFGKKVIAMNVGALSEIAGPNSVIVESGDTMILSHAIIDQINSTNGGDDLIKAHSGSFTWSKSAAISENTYSKALATYLSNTSNIKQRV